MCEYIFPAPVGGTYVTIGRDADLCPRFPGRTSDGSRRLQSGVTMCPACSFAAGEAFHGLDLTFEERYDIEERLREDGLLKVFRESPPPWLAFHAAEVCGKERGLSFRELGDLCLRASWVCRKEKEHPFESTFQLRAVRYFMRSLENDGLHGWELPVTAYLVGELNRRLGHNREALNWYVNAERTLEKPEAENLAWLDRLISRQRELAESEAA